MCGRETGVKALLLIGGARFFVYSTIMPMSLACEGFREEGSVDEVGLLSFSRSGSSSIGGVPGSCVSETIFPLLPAHRSV